MTAKASATLPETVLDWEAISAACHDTETGKKLAAEEALRVKGEGLPHMTSKLRLFGHSEEDPRDPVPRPRPIVRTVRSSG